MGKSEDIFVLFRMDFKCFSTASFYGRRFNNLSNAVNAIEQDERNAVYDIAVIPPDADYNTDEYEIDIENLDNEQIPKDVPGNIELFIRDEEYDSEDEVPLSLIRASILEQSQS